MEHSRTPNQLYVVGMLHRFGSGWREVREVFDNDDVDEFYGTETDEDHEEPEIVHEEVYESFDLADYTIPVQCAEELKN